MSNALITAIKKRRTQYSLGRKLPLPQAEVEALIKEAVRLAPSAFNSQSSRITILFGAQSDKLWDIAKAELRKIVPADGFAKTAEKLESFAAGAGTVLFYEDQNSVKELQKQFPLYADNFPVWSEQASGMAQFAVWAALANVNIGASLQHYNPLIDSETAKTWAIPDSWKLRAQMPFGANEQPFPEKTFISNAVRFKTFG
ncbi:MAG: nitroreductase family protein [Candidatus Tokpelaia sp.]|uniref:nitroreductase family protein n=1 Tax=Candidatus Tokpelaia sp. TaxID=2233777 RepID=UPI00123B8627|nr:nitroreductase family protein [Candidatus Tokpelaia sp.]KAA6204614.1 MAG: nitroreductase family protein [Candidatus Tokpelaia sp.]KAA6205528.1 MAG: nitroreductase family protein [Candidatus Tokpelaia sp.]KAA6405582.1 nitroreductase family protein [Candidatus Tokpelaia sp.]